MICTGDITRNEMRKVLKLHGFKVRTRKKKKSGDDEASSSEESDSSTDCSSNGTVESVRGGGSTDSSDDGEYRMRLLHHSKSSDSDGDASTDDSEVDPIVQKYGYLTGTYHEDEDQLFLVTAVGEYNYNGKTITVAWRKRYDGDNMLVFICSGHGCATYFMCCSGHRSCRRRRAGSANKYKRCCKNVQYFL